MLYRDSDDPVGDVIAGTRLVASSSKARARVLAQVLETSGYDASMLADAFVATGDSPFDDVYQIPGGALAAGARVADPFGEYEPFALDDGHYVFWIDPAAHVELGRPLDQPAGFGRIERLVE